MVLEKNKGNARSKPFFLENINFWESLPRAPNFEYPKKRTTLCKWPLSFYIFTEAAYI